MIIQPFINHVMPELAVGRKIALVILQKLNTCVESGHQVGEDLGGFYLPAKKVSDNREQEHYDGTCCGKDDVCPIHRSLNFELKIF